MSPKRGDVYLACFPNSDLVTFKRRPVLVVQADSLQTGLGQTVVAMISSNPARSGHPSRVPVELQTPEGLGTGLKLDSWIMTDNLATLEYKLLEKCLGKWSHMYLIDAALRITLGI